MSAKSISIKYPIAGTAVKTITEQLAAMTASTAYEGMLSVTPILNADGFDVVTGNETNGFDTSLSFSGSVFVTQKNTVEAVTADGDFFVNPFNGYYKVIAGASATPVATYKIRQSNIDSSILASVYHTAAYAASGAIKASQGVLFSIFGYNSKASAQFIQIFDSATVPADTAVPIITFTVPASSNFAIDSNSVKVPFTNGIAWSNSSTGPTKTIGSADVFLTAVYD